MLSLASIDFTGILKGIRKRTKNNDSKLRESVHGQKFERSTQRDDIACRLSVHSNDFIVKYIKNSAS